MGLYQFNRIVKTSIEMYASSDPQSKGIGSLSFRVEKSSAMARLKAYRALWCLYSAVAALFRAYICAEFLKKLLVFSSVT